MTCDYMEDDLLLSDPEFFAKVLYLNRQQWPTPSAHRCERPGQGHDSSRDPDTTDLFWDTGEVLSIPWPLRTPSTGPPTHIPAATS